MNKNNLIKIVIIIVALSGMILLNWLFLFDGKTSKISETAQNAIQEKKISSPEIANTPQPVEIKGENLGQQKLSEEIPHYEQMEKIEAYTLKYPNSARIQDVYRFYSAKSMAENLTYYTGWAAKNNWISVNTVKEKDVYSLYLTKAKDAETLVVKISQDENKVKVNLDLLKN